ncbi:thioredoxin family protein [Microbacterium sp. C5A9]|uniref:thioredoxin family protein n=1 Tax=Microbacterium sp. C5A9 TaxID=2736663 RepID=UPI001F51ACB1|nr:thioredoxin family protein [Microbacterium sp. C5A9]MCI1017827.1 thioredoxin family protein [Microbacterium sp. C5A9]
MTPGIALAVIGALVVIAVIVGVVQRVLDGRRRTGGHLRFDPADADTDRLGSHATLVQFSTEMCTRCPQVRRMLSSFVADTDDDAVQHLEVDLTHRPDLSARYKVMQTPTTFVVDASGAVRARFHGVPHRHALTDALAAV